MYSHRSFRRVAALTKAVDDLCAVSKSIPDASSSGTKDSGTGRIVSKAEMGGVHAISFGTRDSLLYGQLGWNSEEIACIRRREERWEEQREERATMMSHRYEVCEQGSKSASFDHVHFEHPLCQRTISSSLPQRPMHDLAGIHDRLARAEDQFFEAISNDSLARFQENWTQLLDDIAAAAEVEHLSECIQVHADTVAMRIEMIAKGFSELSVKSQELTQSLLQNVEEVLGKGNLFESRNTTEDHPPASSLPSYVPTAYAWIVENLHCPYPSAAMRDSLSKESGSSRKCIDAWFTDARKRIGWNALRKSRFSGKKHEIIRAAGLYFYGEVVDDSLALEFASIRMAAKELYGDKMCLNLPDSQPILCSESSIAVKDHGKSLSQRYGYDVYPSPDSRRCSVSSPPPLSCSPPPVTTSLKRQYPADPNEELIRMERSSRPSKRQR